MASAYLAAHREGCVSDPEPQISETDQHEPFTAWPGRGAGSADGDRGIRGNDTVADTLGAEACDVAKKHHGAVGQQRQIP
jgi:hypothetical protein